MSKENLFSVLLIVLLTATSCMKKEEEQAVLIDAKIVGSWRLRQNCSSVSYGYVKNSAVYEASGMFTRKSEVYPDSSCATKHVTEEIQGTYSLGTFTDNMLSTKTDLNLTYVAVLWTPATTAVANGYNMANLCGFNDWAVGVPKDVSGRTCDTATILASGATVYTFYKYQVADQGPVGPIPAKYAGDVTFGTSSYGPDGLSEAQRHTVEDGGSFRGN